MGMSHFLSHFLPQAIENACFEGFAKTCKSAKHVRILFWEQNGSLLLKRNMRF